MLLSFQLLTAPTTVLNLNLESHVVGLGIEFRDTCWNLFLIFPLFCSCHFFRAREILKKIYLRKFPFSRDCVWSHFLFFIFIILSFPNTNLLCFSQSWQIKPFLFPHVYVTSSSWDSLSNAQYLAMVTVTFFFAFVMHL